jgi:pimeloyl-ACP methyl ester carboxylesterase
MGEFRFEGHKITYDEYGDGDRVLVLIHGLLMNSSMFERLGPALAERGNRVICVNLLGHGQSGGPHELPYYSMSSFADQVVALLDHLEVEQAVIGGTSLGANVSLEFAARTPERARGLFMEMPVLENALLAVAVIFTPIMVLLQLGGPLLRMIAIATRSVPRSNYFVDIALDFVRRDPSRSADVLQGLLLGRSAPLPEERKQMPNPALVIGHPNDPLHPFSDADMVVHEMPNARLVDANSILEWRISPNRLDGELADFLDEVWKKPTRAKRGRKASAKRGVGAGSSGKDGGSRTNSGKPRAKKRTAGGGKASREAGTKAR